MCGSLAFCKARGNVLVDHDMHEVDDGVNAYMHVLTPS